MKKTARILVTEDCKKNCQYCCNKYEHIMKQAKIIKSPEDIPTIYKDFCITGGEPLLHPKITRNFIEELQYLQPGTRMFLYTAIFTPELRIIDRMLCGIQYTVHERAGLRDTMQFYRMQDYLNGKTWLSKRLYIHAGMKRQLIVHTNTWNRIKKEKWVNAEDCELPKNEDLYILRK